MKSGVQIWGNGVESMYRDLEVHPRPYNVSMVPDLDCDNVINMHWRDGRELYKYVVDFASSLVNVFLEHVDENLRAIFLVTMKERCPSNKGHFDGN